jgi:hypothetical protein
MARTIQEIETKIKQEFVSNETLRSLYGLDSEKTFDRQFSKVSIEAVLIFLFASSCWLLEQLWDAFSKDIENKIENSYVTSISWYFHKALEFQKGDALVFDASTYSYGYATVDTSKQVVKNVAIRQVEDDGVTKLKVYFSDAGKQPLAEGVRASFERYMRDIGAAGTHFLFVSRAPDPIRIQLQIFYDPLIMDSLGARIDGTGKPVEEAIENYLKNIEYGGVFYSSALVDVIQTTEGVKDVVLKSTTWSGTTELRRKIESYSGAFVYEKNASDITYLID